MILSVPLLFAERPAAAGPPLAELTRVAVHQGGVWVVDGRLVVGDPWSADRAAVVPLEGLTPTSLPADRTGWKEVGAGCIGPLQASPEGPLSVQVKVRAVAPPWEGSLVFWRGEAEVGRVALPPGLQPCEVLVQDLGGPAGRELVLVWRHQDLVGVTAWSWPEP